jgi:hypothetical protein
VQLEGATELEKLIHDACVHALLDFSATVKEARELLAPVASAKGE